MAMKDIAHTDPPRATLFSTVNNTQSMIPEEQEKTMMLCVA